MPIALNAVHRDSTLGEAGAIRGVVDDGAAACCGGETICLVRRKPGVNGLSSRVVSESTRNLTDSRLCPEDTDLNQNAGEIEDPALVHDRAIL